MPSVDDRAAPRAAPHPPGRIKRSPAGAVLALVRARARAMVTLLVIAAVIVAVVVVDPVARVRAWIIGDGPQAASGDTVLLQIRETAELTAATGEFSVPVFLDSEKKSVWERIVPDVFDGEQVVAIYQGEVRAVVDLQGLVEGDIVTDPETSSLQITVDDPRLTEPNIDEEKSKVVAHNRGILTRLEDALGDTPLATRDALDQEAVKAISKAARESNLQGTARDNSRVFLESLGKSMGYENVTVTFTPSRE